MLHVVVDGGWGDGYSLMMTAMHEAKAGLVLGRMGMTP